MMTPSISEIVAMTAGLSLVAVSLLLTALGIWLAYRPRVRMHAGLYTRIPSRWRLNVLVWGFWAGHNLEHVSEALRAFDQSLIKNKPEWRADFQNLMRSTYVQFHLADPQYGEGKRLNALGFYKGEPIIAHGLADGDVLHVVFEARDHLRDTAFLHEIGHRMREFQVGSYDSEHKDKEMWGVLVADAKRLFAEGRS